VELLVVLAIVGVLMALLIPALGYGVALAHETSCLNNLRQISPAAYQYKCQYDCYPPAWKNDKCRWMDLLKPYLDKACRQGKIV
jgi:type II secretory pathway pseudopilin PulG